MLTSKQVRHVIRTYHPCVIADALIVVYSCQEPLICRNTLFVVVPMTYEEAYGLLFGSGMIDLYQTTKPIPPVSEEEAYELFINGAKAKLFEERKAKKQKEPKLSFGLSDDEWASLPKIRDKSLKVLDEHTTQLPLIGKFILPDQGSPEFSGNLSVVKYNPNWLFS